MNCLFSNIMKLVPSFQARAIRKLSTIMLKTELSICSGTEISVLPQPSREREGRGTAGSRGTASPHCSAGAEQEMCSRMAAR